MKTTSSSTWSRTKVTTLSYVLLGMMLITGVFFTSAFAYLGHSIDDIATLGTSLQTEATSDSTLPQQLNEKLQALKSTNTILLWFVPIAAGFFFILMYVTLIHKIVTPLNTLEKGILEITSNNDFSLRIQQAHQDEIGSVIHSFNGLIDSLEQNFDSFSQILQRVSSGDFSKRCALEARGDLKQIKDQLNTTFDSVEITMTSLQTVANGIAQGDFSVRVDERVQGSIRQDVDHAMNRTSSILNEISGLMRRLNQGDFSGRIDCDAYGQMADLKQHINNSVSHIAQAIHAFSDVVAAQANGDLTQQLPKGQFKGQLHELKNAINYSIAKLSEVVEVVMQTSNSVNHSSDKVAAGSMQLNQEVLKQASAVAQTSVTIEQLTTSVQANVNDSKTTAEEAQSVMHKAQQGHEIMQKTIAAMQRIQTSSQQIAEIVTLIDGIAFQTNLLALNAAVEAARAGEHGKGFAVVAGEVRNLAQKSAEAARDIKQLIESSVHRINEGTERVTESGKALAEMNQSIEHISQQITSISQASEQQGKGILQVREAIGMVDTATKTSTQMVAQTQTESEQLHALAKHLQEYIRFFSIEQSAQTDSKDALPLALIHR